MLVIVFDTLKLRQAKRRRKKKKCCNKMLVPKHNVYGRIDGNKI